MPLITNTCFIVNNNHQTSLTTSYLLIALNLIIRMINYDNQLNDGVYLFGIGDNAFGIPNYETGARESQVLLKKEEVNQLVYLGFNGRKIFVLVPINEPLNGFVTYFVKVNGAVRLIASDDVVSPLVTFNNSIHYRDYNTVFLLPLKYIGCNFARPEPSTRIQNSSHRVFMPSAERHAIANFPPGPSSYIPAGLTIKPHFESRVDHGVDGLGDLTMDE